MLEVGLVPLLPDPEFVLGYYPASNGLPRRTDKDHYDGHPVKLIQSLHSVSSGRHMLQEMADKNRSESAVRERDMGNTTNHRTRMTTNRASVNIKSDIAATVSRFVEPAAG